MPEGQNVPDSSTNQQVDPAKILNFTLNAEGRYVGPDGKKYVPESDLMALKSNHEKAISDTQNAHSTSIDGLRVQLSTAQQEIAKRDAKLKELQDASKTGAFSAEDKARLESELNTTKTTLESVNKSALEYRKQLLTAKYPTIEPAKLEGKTAVQLDALEEALSAVGAARGAGNYALSGGAGGGAIPQTAEQRAQKVLSEAAEKGHVYGPLGAGNKTQ